MTKNEFYEEQAKILENRSESQKIFDAQEIHKILMKLQGK